MYPWTTSTPSFASVQQVSKGLEDVFGADAVTVSVQDAEAAGQTVDHLHVHVLPRKQGDFQENDEIYDHLEAWGFDKHRPSTYKTTGRGASAAWTPTSAASRGRKSRWRTRRATSPLTSRTVTTSPSLPPTPSPYLSLPSSVDATTTRTSKLPVTLLSGFFGAGKTTLLTHILTSSTHNLRIGVIVNMAQLNIDATLNASRHSITQSEERLVQMQNDGICCTLRGDLLEEVPRLAERGDIDYLVIESTGISESMQVAETFSVEFAQQWPGNDEQRGDKDDDGGTMPKPTTEDGATTTKATTGDENEAISPTLAALLAQGGLSSVSRLDTCVTVIDALNLFSNFQTADFLTDRHSRDYVPAEDDRTISDLQADQLEFANVLLINKSDLVPRSEIERIKSLCKILNPDARIIATTKGNVELEQILNTGMFHYEKAALGAGWLRSLNEVVKPETEEYGIGSFVYRARRPFHPERLWEVMREVFVVIQDEFVDDGEDEGDEEKMDIDGDSNATSDDNDNDGDDDEDQEEPQLDPSARLASKTSNETFSPLLRSKGFIWLATRPSMFGEWSQAGVMLTLSGGGRWFCEVPTSDWPQDQETCSSIQADFQGQWGDRRQEIVLIGQQMREGGEERLKKAFDDCLLDDKEWKKWQEIMKSKRKEDEVVGVEDSRAAEGVCGWL